MDHSILTKCDACKGTFRLTGYELRKLADDVELTYFQCPHCQKEYRVFYTDKETRELQEEVRRLSSKFDTAPSSAKKKWATKFRKAQKQLSFRMNLLKVNQDEKLK